MKTLNAVNEEIISLQNQIINIQQSIIESHEQQIDALKKLLELKGVSND